jgi:hypothetical protein
VNYYIQENLLKSEPKKSRSRSVFPRLPSHINTHTHIQTQKHKQTNNSFANTDIMHKRPSLSSRLSSLQFPPLSPEVDVSYGLISQLRRIFMNHTLFCSSETFGDEDEEKFRNRRIFLTKAPTIFFLSLSLFSSCKNIITHTLSLQIICRIYIYESKAYTVCVCVCVCVCV